MRTRVRAAPGLHNATLDGGAGSAWGKPRRAGIRLEGGATLEARNVVVTGFAGATLKARGNAPAGVRWIGCSPGFFLPVRTLSRQFRRLFLERREAAFRNGRLQFFQSL